LAKFGCRKCPSYYDYLDSQVSQNGYANTIIPICP
jgi:hypothetical protein